ncbi:MAG: hypothetical protein DRJ49_07900 [Thermoprotei archaeon]|nr:MAG: hypothetical protein DRJ49_07900 [Thermoprotei archaeon]
MNRVDVRVDSRVELLSIVQMFTSWRDSVIVKKDYKYKRDALEWFKPYRNHRVIELCEYLRDFQCMCMPTGFMVHVTEPPELKFIEKLDLNTIYSFTWFISSKLGDWFNKYFEKSKAIKLYGINRSKYALLPGLKARAEEELMLLGEFMAKRVLNEFIEYLRNFVYKSNFIEFFDMHRSFYEALIEKSKLKHSVPKIISYLKDFFKKYEEHVSVILCPLYGSFAFGHGFNDKTFVFIGPRRIVNDFPIFEGVEDLILNELSRIVGIYCARYFDEIMEYSYLFEYLGDYVKSTHGVWIQALNVHLASAIEAIIKHHYMGIPKEEIASYLDQKERMGFIFVKDFYKLLDEYVKKKDEYNSFEEFFPRIIKLLKTLAESTSKDLERKEDLRRG